MANAISKRQKPSRYTDQEVEQGLFALAMASGNTRRASAMLQKRGLRVPHTTLDTWKHRTHPERYERIKQDAYPRIAEQMAEDMEALFAAEVELEWELVAKFREELANLKPADVAGALRNIGVTKALNVDKSAPLRGRPNQIVGVSAGDAQARLKRKLERLGVTIEGTAEEVDESTA